MKTASAHTFGQVEICTLASGKMVKSTISGCSFGKTVTSGTAFIKTEIENQGTGYMSGTMVIMRQGLHPFTSVKEAVCRVIVKTAGEFTSMKMETCTLDIGKTDGSIISGLSSGHLGIFS